VAEGEEEEDELKRPDVPRSGSITDDALVAVELKQLESVPTVEEVVDDDGILEPL
jgi:hypothetical protein